MLMLMLIIINVQHAKCALMDPRNGQSQTINDESEESDETRATKTLYD